MRMFEAAPCLSLSVLEYVSIYQSFIHFLILGYMFAIQSLSCLTIILLYPAFKFSSTYINIRVLGNGNTGSVDKHSYASVPDMEVSNFLNMLFKNNDNSTKIYVQCKYHKNFKKWIPYKLTDTMDSLEIINKIQIILDSE